MTAEGRIQSAARWIRGAYGLMASAVGKTDVGYDKSRWQRIGRELNRSGWACASHCSGSRSVKAARTSAFQPVSLTSQYGMPYTSPAIATGQPSCCGPPSAL